MFWEAVLVIGANENDDNFSDNVKASVQSYISKCVHLKELSMVFDSPMFLFGPTLVTFAQSVLPHLSEMNCFKTYECNDWFIQTALGKMLYSEYTPDSILNATNVLEIVKCSVMANDVLLLTRFGLNNIPFGIDRLHGIASVSENIEYISENETKACINFNDCTSTFLGFRHVVLKRGDASDPWQLVFLGTFMYSV